MTASEDNLGRRRTPGSRSNISIPRRRLVKFCRKYHVRKLSFFGSVLRADFNPESDIDVLVEFEPGYIIGYVRLAGAEIELSQILGRKVDLRTPGDLSRYFRDEVMKGAEVQYAVEGG